MKRLLLWILRKHLNQVITDVKNEMIRRADMYRDAGLKVDAWTWVNGMAHELRQRLVEKVTE